MLITGFGPFGEVDKNPSQWLAESLGLPFEIIPVSWAAADAFVERISANPPDQILHLGVARKATKIRIELVAHNRIDATPDVDGVIAGPGPVDPAADQQLGTTLWRNLEFFQDESPIDSPPSFLIPLTSAASNPDPSFPFPLSSSASTPDPSLPSGSTPAVPSTPKPVPWQASVDAGGYLCNYLYFQSLKKLQNTDVGFLHVPPESAIPLPMQLEIVREILNVMSVNTGLTLKS